MQIAVIANARPEGEKYFAFIIYVYLFMFYASYFKNDRYYYYNIMVSRQNLIKFSIV